ncbi:hypothetical protein FNH05_06550 [Amycolatopsis rhizosphaerae]|uniref:Uncharacterized protein n=1 Tax=Amycolatopsis rhizosphaerae TaxID=2053003 RepID=A0A558DBU2_9PSEU|nr:hypothetical protein [Amycolatopsis rhizosphaerae]TVT58461.1 hypothetical protein FNH05_06550 [Amycolatopsis rhizosphaerae]
MSLRRRLLLLPPVVLVCLCLLTACGNVSLVGRPSPVTAVPPVSRVARVAHLTVAGVSLAYDASWGQPAGDPRQEVTVASGSDDHGLVGLRYIERLDGQRQRALPEVFAAVRDRLGQQNKALAWGLVTTERLPGADQGLAAAYTTSSHGVPLTGTMYLQVAPGGDAYVAMVQSTPEYIEAIRGLLERESTVGDTNPGQVPPSVAVKTADVNGSSIAYPGEWPQKLDEEGAVYLSSTADTSRPYRGTVIVVTKGTQAGSAERLPQLMAQLYQYDRANNATDIYPPGGELIGDDPEQVRLDGAVAAMRRTMRIEKQGEVVFRAVDYVVVTGDGKFRPVRVSSTEGQAAFDAADEIFRTRSAFREQ